MCYIDNVGDHIGNVMPIYDIMSGLIANVCHDYLIS
jgi:hypothetical protein